MIRKQSHHFFSKSVGDWSLNICSSIHAQAVKCVVLLCLFPGDRLRWHFAKMDNEKSKVDNKVKSRAKKRKSEIIKLKSDINVVIEGIVDHRNVDAGTIRNSSKRNFVKANVNGKNDHHKKHKYAPEEMTPGKSFTQKEFSNIFSNITAIGVGMLGMWGVDPNLKRVKQGHLGGSDS